MSKKITTFNKQTLATCRTAIQSKLDELKEEFGIEVKLGNISFSADNFTSKISVGLVGGPDEYQREYEELVKYNLIQDGLVGLEFTKNGSTFKFRGIQPRARTNKFLAENLTKGGVFKFSEADILKLLKISNPKIAEEA